MIDNPSFRAPTPDEINEMRADLVAAHAHIELLHKLIGQATRETPVYLTNPSYKGALRELTLVAAEWEESQC
ncbi:hypothetical protein HT094_09215 [Shewanella sp. ZOR0012]|uniref:hypothetical protein n=1 Tax=Shewanella sp. ZOR0012 TaxID=1339231 RepID=UPI0006466895|nr:hypothetical protein [Shewanella sp. ZOR0012]NSM24512.1 hypothetical protein [Shewanella sp. ZOR0012]